MASIQGPLIRFVVDTPGLSAAVGPAMQQVQQQAKQTTAAIADSWRQTAAQIRASIATGVSSQKEMTSEQTKLVGILDKQISQLRQRNDLTNKELASLKAMTLERERQADAIKRGVSVGVTSGTSSALNQVSTQTVLGLERVLDSLVDRFFGGAAGAAVRTARDVQYYSAMARGGAPGAAGGTGVLGAVGTGGNFLGLSPTTLGIVGGVAAVGTGVAVVSDLAIKGGKLAEELTKLSEKTGLTTAEVIKLRAASDVLDVDFDRATIGFKKFSSELVLASTADLPGASKSAKELAAIFRVLGVDVKKAAQDPYPAIQQLAKSISQLPDGIAKTNVATILFGRGGMELIPVFDKLSVATALTAKSSKDLADAISGANGSVDAEEKLRAATVNFRQEVGALEVALSQKLLPAMVEVVGWINELGAGKHPMAAAVLTGGGSLLAQGSQWVTQKFLEAANFGVKGGDAADALAKQVAEQSTAAATIAGKQAEDLMAIIGKVGDGSKDAAKKAREAAEEFKRAYDAWEKMISAHPTEKENQTRIQERHNEIMDQILGTGKAPEINSPVLNPLPLGPSTTAPKSILDELKSVNEEYDKLMQSETDKIKSEFDEQLTRWKNIQAGYPQIAQQAADAIVKIQEEENKKLADLQQKAFEKYKKDADQLFDELISGKTKSFTKTLQKQLEDIVTQPMRKVFEQIVGTMLQGLDAAINGKPGTGTGPASSGGLGGVLSRIGLGGTAGTFPGSVGLGGKTAGTVAVQSGQTGVMTQTMNVQANVVNIGSGTGTPGATGASFTGGTGLPQFGSFFGNNNPFGGGASFFGNNNPFGGSTSAGGGINPNALAIAGGLLVGGLGVKSGSVTSEAMGAAAVAGGLARLFSGSASAIGPTSSTQTLGGQLSGIFGGAGMLASGLSQPGFSGELSDIGGGAAIGTAIMPGLGTAIGAAAGAVAGLIKGIFSGPSWGQRVKEAMKNQQTILPPSETFDFAEGNSISQTLSQGFSQSGNTFSTFQLPANTPFWANSIHGPLSKLQQQQLASEEEGLIPGQPFLGFPNTNPFEGQGPVGSKKGSSTPNVNVTFNLPSAIDQTTAGPFFAAHANNIARAVASQLASGSSGMMSMTRNAVALP